MKKQKYMGIIAMFMMISVLVWLTGCGPTAQSYKGETQVGEAADIDDLLGLSDQEKDAEETSDIAEDDVLRLLGVTEEDQATVTETDPNAQKVDVKDEKQNNMVDNANKDAANADKNVTDTTEPGKENEIKTQPINKTRPEWRATSYSDRYDEAYSDYRNRQYRIAIQKFEALLSVNTSHSLSDNCQYWIGESYYGMENYEQAIVAFEKVFSFPKSNKDEDSQLKLGLCHLRLGDKERAKIELQKYIDSYPTGEHVSAAKRFIGGLENQ